MHHKRKRPKSTRAGCLLCKPHKRQGTCLHQRAKPSDRVRIFAADEQVRHPEVDWGRAEGSEAW